MHIFWSGKWVSPEVESLISHVTYFTEDVTYFTKNVTYFTKNVIYFTTRTWYQHALHKAGTSGCPSVTWIVLNCLSMNCR